VKWTDTGETLYRRLEKVAVELFKESWPVIREGKESRFSQSGLKGTYHTSKDVQKIDEIDLDGTYSARNLINIIRARTFPPYEAAYFRNGDKRVYMRIQLLYEDELED
jgi:methionyl-tRNA formyltransferase